ncbi:MAG: hypothetical protein NWE92_11930 [Candidatus Bathyarchaeota archaeon]|nr:hypothetical protein [Candidatus Bathyarchaeota archaeon]
MKLLISPINAVEAQAAIQGGADIIDVKNPKEGALGANFPWVIREIKAMTPRNLEVSCTIGEAPLTGSMALAAFGAASLGVDYVKVGLKEAKNVDEAVAFLEQIRRAAKEANPQVKVVAAGYGDAQKIGALHPLLIPEIAHLAKVEVAMIDTSVKDGTTLFDNLTIEEIQKFVASAHGYGLQVALAGSLRKEQLPLIYKLGADIAGLRGAACTNNDRVDGEISATLVKNLVEMVKNAETQAKTVRS